MQRIPGRDESSISCLAWVADPKGGSPRLFSGGLDGDIVEWDLRARKPKAVTSSFGGAVWGIAVERVQNLQPGIS